MTNRPLRLVLNLFATSIVLYLGAALWTWGNSNPKQAAPSAARALLGFWFILLVPWMLAGPLSGMVFDGGATPEAYAFLWSTITYPFSVALAALLRRWFPYAVLLPVLSFAACFASPLLHKEEIRKAQPFDDLLLPHSRRITGIVVDPEGRPVAEARIDHSNDSGQAHQTDVKGRFELDTRAPIVVVRKAGFRSELVRPQDETAVRIALRRGGDGRFRTCSGTSPHEGIEGWLATLQFPVTSDMKASRQVRDVDYGARSYYVDTKSGPKGIMHGSGPLWGLGMPEDRDVWQSVKYEEIAYDFGGLTILDARGQLANGTHWRWLGKFGESASYSGVDEVTAKLLDKVLDGACVKPKSRLK